MNREMMRKLMAERTMIKGIESELAASKILNKESFTYIYENKSLEKEELVSLVAKTMDTFKKDLVVEVTITAFSDRATFECKFR